MVCRAVAQGSGGVVVGPHFRPGNPGFLYGTLRGLDVIWGHLAKSSLDWWYGDNGYLRPSNHAEEDYSGYYRLGFKSRFGFSVAEPRYDRLERLGIHLKPWRSSNKGYVLVCPSPKDHKKIWGHNSVNWENATVRRLGQIAPKLKIVVSYKPLSDERCPETQPPLSELLGGARAVVTWDSNVAVDALIAGVPIFVRGPHPASNIGNQDLRQIEQPVCPDFRRSFLATLAANQWTLDEFRSGLAAREAGILSPNP